MRNGPGLRQEPVLHKVLVSPPRGFNPCLTTKLTLLDSLRQEVGINSWQGWVARLRVRSG